MLAKQIVTLLASGFEKWSAKKQNVTFLGSGFENRANIFKRKCKQNLKPIDQPIVTCEKCQLLIFLASRADIPINLNLLKPINRYELVWLPASQF